MSDQIVVRLDRGQTRVTMSRNERQKAIKSAFWVTCSPCEYKWTDEQAAEMARYVLWAHQRLSAIEQCASGELANEASDAQD